MDNELMLDVSQAHEIKMAARRAGATNADLKRLSEGNMLARVLPIVRGVGRVVVDKLPIDRSKPFDPEAYFGKGWSIWKGSADGDGLSGEEEQDPQALALAELDFSRFRLVRTLNQGEAVVGGEENLRRLREAPHLCLDAKAFETLLENWHFLPDLLKENTNGNTTFVFCHGTTLRNPRGDRYVLSQYFGGGDWRWECRWLGGVWGVRSPTLVLAS